MLKKLLIPASGFRSPKVASTITGKSTRVSPNSTCNSVKRTKSARSVKLNQKFSTKPKEIDEDQYKFYLPSHLEVIQRIKKITKLNQPMPFAPLIPPPQPCNLNLAFSKRDTSDRQLVRDLLQNLNLIENEAKLEKLLFQTKKTERILRQEKDFVRMIRDLKPDIKVEGSGGRVRREVKRRNSFKKYNKSPVSILRSGIFVRRCLEN